MKRMKQERYWSSSDLSSKRSGQQSFLVVWRSCVESLWEELGPGSQGSSVSAGAQQDSLHNASGSVDEKEKRKRGREREVKYAWRWYCKLSDQDRMLQYRCCFSGAAMLWNGWGALGVGGLFEAASRWNTSVYQPLTHKSSSPSRNRREESVIVFRVPLSSTFHIKSISEMRWGVLM